MPSRASIAAAIGADRLARALAPSVTLTASARLRSGRALRRRSSASHETGGAISAVMTNWRERSSCSRREAGCRGMAFILGPEVLARSPRARRSVRVGQAAYIIDRRRIGKGRSLSAQEPCRDCAAGGYHGPERACAARQFLLRATRGGFPGQGVGASLKARQTRLAGHRATRRPMLRKDQRVPREPQ